MTSKDQETHRKTWLKQQGAAHTGPLSLLKIIMALGFISQIVLYWFLSQAVDQLIVQNSALADTTLTGLVIATLLWLVSDHLATTLQIRNETRIQATLEAELNQHLRHRQHALVRQHSTYYWQQLYLEHIPACARFLTQYQPQQLLAGLTPLVVVVAVWPASWMVALVLLVSLPVVPLFMYIVGMGAANLHRKHFVALERLGSLFNDRIKHLLLIKIFSDHRRQERILDNASDDLNRRTMKVVSVAFLSSSVLDFFSTLAVALVAVFVGFNLLGEVKIGPDLTLTTGLFLLLTAPLCFAELKKLGHFYHQKAAAIAAADELQPLLEPPLQELARQHTNVELHWQHFTIDSPSLTAKNLQLETGDWIRLSGVSGAGKTVFLEALMGHRLASHRLSGRLLLLSQSPVITPQTVASNLSLGYEHSDAKLWQALEQVELTSWAESLPYGLNTPMGEAPPLSGGQAQRLALARVLLQEADVVLLDEPTAHLTEDQHQRLSQLIHELVKDKTVIWASHKTLPESWFKHHWQVADGHIKEVL